MKKKYMLMGIAAVLILATMVGGTLAALNTKSEKAVANISIKSVGVTVIGDQPVALADGGEKEPVTIVPGETIIMPKAVQNDIPDGYDVYVKVVIYHAWDTKSGGLVSTGEADDIYVQNQDWIIGYEDDEQMVMYYTKPLAPKQTTTNFMDGIHLQMPSIRYNTKLRRFRRITQKMRSQRSLACSRSLMKMERFCLFQKQDNG